jgi:hypothetical protein
MTPMNAAQDPPPLAPVHGHHHSVPNNWTPFNVHNPPQGVVQNFFNIQFAQLTGIPAPVQPPLVFPPGSRARSMFPRAG